jgi:hypothetical protein
VTTYGLCRNLPQQDSQLRAGPVPVAPPSRYGEDRIAAGTRLLDHIDPGWWREGTGLPANLTALDMADPYRCVLAWWATEHLPAPARSGMRQVPPYDRAMRALGLTPRQAQALGFTGVDVELLTPGWRHLITYLRASDQPVATDPARPPRGRHRPRSKGGQPYEERDRLWKPSRPHSSTAPHTWTRAASRGVGFLQKFRIYT